MLRPFSGRKNRRSGRDKGVCVWINLKIDPEFQSQIPPLTDDEFKQLEEIS